MLVILGYLNCHGLQHLRATCKAVSVHIPGAVRDEERLNRIGLVCGDLWSPLRQLRMFERVFEKEQPQAIAIMNAGRNLADNGFYGYASRMLRVGLTATAKTTATSRRRRRGATTATVTTATTATVTTSTSRRAARQGRRVPRGAAPLGKRRPMEEQRSKATTPTPNVQSLHTTYIHLSILL